MFVSTDSSRRILPAKNKWKAVLSLLLCLGILLSFCSCSAGSSETGPSSSGVVKAPSKKPVQLNQPFKGTFSNLSMSEESYLDAYRQFAFRFFDTFASMDPEGNTCLSPLSAYMAFSLCFAGSEGKTAQEFRDVFGLDKQAAQAFCEGLCASYLQRNTRQETTKIGLANSVWISSEDSEYVKKTYLETATSSFGAPIFSCDFSDPETVREVNQWCSDQTDGLIDRIVDSFDDMQVLALINALLLEASWAHPYESHDVETGPFTKKGGQITNAVYLCRKIEMYYENKTAKAFTMPLCDGFSFVGILPNEEGNIDSFCQNLSSDFFTDLLDHPVYDYSVLTRIPKIKLDYQADLIDGMKEMGLVSAFDSGAADFRSMIEIPGFNVSIGQALQKTHFELDENGIKAAAVTYIGMVKEGGMAEPKPSIMLYLNRPFVYVLMDNLTGLPLFIGTIKSLQK